MVMLGRLRVREISFWEAYFWEAYICSRSSSLRIRAFSFFMVRFQSRYCESQTTAKIAVKIPA